MRVANIKRIDSVLANVYGHKVGMKRNDAIQQLLCDLKRLCKVERRDIEKLLKEA